MDERACNPKITQFSAGLDVEIDAELEKLIGQMMERQKKDDEQRLKTEKESRVEYDEVPDGMSVINFHLTMFLFLCLLALLNLPSVISWAKNFR